MYIAFVAGVTSLLSPEDRIVDRHVYTYIIPTGETSYLHYLLGQILNVSLSFC